MNEPLSPEDLLTLIESRARGLRAAGVTRVQFSVDGAVSFDLRPGSEAEAAPGPRGPLLEDEPLSVFEDPVTFGLPPGTPLPRFRRSGGAHSNPPEDGNE